MHSFWTYSISVLLASTLVILPLRAMADVSKISTPEVTKGKFEFEYIGVRYGDEDTSEDNHQDHRLDINYSPTSRLRTGFELNGEDEPGRASFTSTNVAVKARYETTTQGTWWLSSAVDVKYAFATHDGDADGLSGKLLLQRKEGDWRFIGNFGGGQGIGPYRKAGTKGAHAVQALYQLTPDFAAGAEWQSDLARVFRLTGDKAAHYLGPVATGNLAKWDDTALTGVLAYDVGVSRAAHDDAVRLQLAWVRYF